MKTMIRADHPIFKRIDKIVSDELEVAELVGELMELGYENIVVKPFTEVRKLRTKSRPKLEKKGFTLVELMVIWVIIFLFAIFITETGGLNLVVNYFEKTLAL